MIKKNQLICIVREVKKMTFKLKIMFLKRQHCKVDF